MCVVHTCVYWNLQKTLALALPLPLARTRFCLSVSTERDSRNGIFFFFLGGMETKWNDHFVLALSALGRSNDLLVCRSSFSISSTSSSSSSSSFYWALSLRLFLCIWHIFESSFIYPSQCIRRCSYMIIETTCLSKRHSNFRNSQNDKKKK